MYFDRLLETVTTLVLCVDRTNEVGRLADTESPVIGSEAIRSLVLELGIADPEVSAVNALLATLRVTSDLEEEGVDALPIVVSGSHESMVSADRAIANQLDDLGVEYDPESTVLVLDSAQDERVIPIVESRFRVDSVDRVVVRQARDLESTYYLMKQFLADEELRQTVLVPLGIVLLVFPALSLLAGTAVAFATITAVLGLFLIYMGIGVEDYVTLASNWIQRSLYSGQVSIVTYAVAIGLLIVGVVAGILGTSELQGQEGPLMVSAQFVYDSVLWGVAAGVVASSGRLLDLFIQEERIRLTYLNLPFVVLSVGLVLRGFSGYLLAEAGHIGPAQTPPIDIGVLTVDSIELGAGELLVAYVLTAIIVTLIGVRVASYLSGLATWTDEVSQREVS